MRIQLKRTDVRKLGSRQNFQGSLMIASHQVIVLDAIDRLMSDISVLPVARTGGIVVWL